MVVQLRLIIARNAGELIVKNNSGICFCQTPLFQILRFIF
jgi:hypothetical protein